MYEKKENTDKNGAEKIFVNYSKNSIEKKCAPRFILIWGVVLLFLYTIMYLCPQIFNT